jgi:hypothetical protein
MAAIWLGTHNPFQLPEPPPWWQDLVFDYDGKLRVMPSQKDLAYRLVRLVKRENRLGLTAGVQHDHPDTKQMIAYGCVPVATLSGAWRPSIIAELRSRDIWAQGGADAVVDRLEEGEQRVEQRKDAVAHDELDQRNADAFKIIKAAKGERLSLRDINRGRVGRPVNPNPVSVPVRNFRRAMRAAGRDIDDASLHGAIAASKS